MHICTWLWLVLGIPELYFKGKRSAFMLKLEPNSTNHNYNGLKTNYLSCSFLCVDFNVNSVMFPVINYHGCYNPQSHKLLAFKLFVRGQTVILQARS